MCVTFAEIRELIRFQIAKVTFEVSKSDCCWRHLIGHIQFPFSLCLYLALISDIAIFVLKRDVKLQLTNSILDRV